MRALPSFLISGASLLALATNAQAQNLESTLFFGNGETDDRLGNSAAVSGDTMILGSPNDRLAMERSGSAVFFTRSMGTWSQLQRIRPSDGVDGDGFGTSVAIDGDTAVIGSPFDGLGGGGGAAVSEDQGSAYVFVFSGGTWVQQAKLTANDNEEGDNFGTSVAIDGDTIVVGSIDADGLDDDTGGVYVYTRSGTTWSQQAKITASDGAFKDRFGTSVALDGNTVLIGASSADPFVNNDGAAYVFENSGGSWSETQKLTLDASQDTARFGFSVALDGDQALIGATRADVGGVLEQGGAYVFTRTAGVWSEQTVLSGPTNGSGDAWGFAVALEGGIAAVGSTQINTNQGGVAFFSGSGASWGAGNLITAPGAMDFDGFGTSIGIDGTRVVVGAPRADGAESDSGLGYAYALGASIDAYCFCEAGPCFNEVLDAGCGNSTGNGALLTTTGSGSVATDDLVFTVSDVPSGQFGILYMGGGQTTAFFGDGNRCVGAGPSTICRYPVQSTGMGSFGEGPGLVGFTQTLEADCRIEAGDTWNFQAWFRDPAGPCGSGFNLSNAVSVTFVP